MKRGTARREGGVNKTKKRPARDKNAELAVSDACWCNKDDSTLRLLEAGHSSGLAARRDGVDKEVSKRQPKRQLKERAEFHAGLFAPFPLQC